MTTKELLRRLEAFSSFDSAALEFSESDIEYVYRVEVCYLNNSKRVDYTSSYIFVLDPEVSYHSVSRFTRQMFDIQVKYFKSFFSRASKTQQEYISKSMLVDNLLRLL